MTDLYHDILGGIDEEDDFSEDAYLQDKALDKALAETDREKIFQFTGAIVDMTTTEAINCSHRIKFNIDRRQSDEFDTALCLYELNERKGWRRLKNFKTGEYYKNFVDCALGEFNFKHSYSYRLVAAANVLRVLVANRTFSTTVEKTDFAIVDFFSDGKHRIKINALKTIGDYDIKGYIPLYVKSCELAGELPPNSRHIKEAARLLGFVTKKELNSDHNPNRSWTEDLFVDEDRQEVSFTAKTRYAPDSLFQIPHLIIKFSDFEKAGLGLIVLNSKKNLVPDGDK